MNTIQIQIQKKKVLIDLRQETLKSDNLIEASIIRID